MDSSAQALSNVLTRIQRGINIAQAAQQVHQQPPFTLPYHSPPQVFAVGTSPSWLTILPGRGHVVKSREQHFRFRFRYAQSTVQAQYRRRAAPPSSGISSTVHDVRNVGAYPCT